MKNRESFCKLLLWYIIIIIFCINISSTSDRKNLGTNYLKVLDLRCEYATNPIGMDVQFPQLSWCIGSEKRGTLQSAYQIIVSDSQESLADDKANIWDSGKIISEKYAGVNYSGTELLNRERYFWKVRVWDSNNILSDWSEPTFFEMGLLTQEDWKADWVSITPKWNGKVLYFKKQFEVSKKVQKARAYISGLGYYELFINDKKIGDHVLDPSVSRYNKRIYYATYDISASVEKENVIVAIVGPGWYSNSILRMQIEITYDDGTKKLITSNGSSVSTGTIVESSIYDGENYDAREEYPELFISANPASTYNKKWGSTRIANDPGGKMVSQKPEPIKITDIIVPQVIKEPVPGIFVADAGQNIAGWTSLKIKGERGTKISLKFAENLYDNGTINQKNLNFSMAEDTYILKGDGEEQWEPAFTYHGFRYIQIEGFPYPPKVGDIKVKIVRSAVNKTGKFRCSNDLLNRIHKMVVSTEASNLHSIPTDCPQRAERMRWLNDLTVRIEQALLLIPEGSGKKPAVIVVYYEPETAIGNGKEYRDFAYQLTKRGFVTLSVGTTATTNSKTYSLYYPDIQNSKIQPLSVLAYAAANTWFLLSKNPNVDPKQIGIVGHSYGGKWAMFASCLFDEFACAVWSDPGIVFDETRPSVNYWEPWYLGYYPPPWDNIWRKKGLITGAKGLYPKLLADGYDLHELHALMAPRPFLVSGGSEDTPERWIPLNHTISINKLLGYNDRVAMTNRPDHSPNVESNEQIYMFFEYFLKYNKIYTK